jgi:regulator of replication initiation timing
MESELKQNVGCLIGANKKLKAKIHELNRQIESLILENRKLKRKMYTQIMKHDIEEHLDRLCK